LNTVLITAQLIFYSKRKRRVDIKRNRSCQKVVIATNKLMLCCVVSVVVLFNIAPGFLITMYSFSDIAC